MLCIVINFFPQQPVSGLTNHKKSIQYPYLQEQFQKQESPNAFKQTHISSFVYINK